jgi:hypothetical protein
MFVTYITVENPLSFLKSGPLDGSRAQPDDQLQMEVVCCYFLDKVLAAG